MKKQGGFFNIAQTCQTGKRCVAFTLTLLLLLGIPTDMSRVASAAASFFDNFEEGSMNWDLDDGWRHSEFDGNGVLEGSGHQWAGLKTGNWCNYSFASMIRMFSGTMHLSFRKFDDEIGLNRYFVGVSNSSLYLKKQIGDKFYECADTRINLDNNDWHMVDVRAYEPKFPPKL